MVFDQISSMSISKSISPILQSIYPMKKMLVYDEFSAMANTLALEFYNTLYSENK